MISPKARSVLLAVIGGMMAAALLHSRGIIDLGFGFPRGGFVEGALIAITGALAGFAVFLVYRKLRNLTGRASE